MIHAYELVKKVFTRFRGLPVRLSGATTKTADWYRSHAQEPKNQNPNSWGNLSEVEHYMRYCRLFELERGAGQYLNNLVYKELAEEFTEQSFPDVTQNQIHSEILNEGCDVHDWLINFDFEKATRPQHDKFQDECDEAIDAIAKAKARSRLAVDRGKRVFAANGNGGKR